MKMLLLKFRGVEQPDVKEILERFAADSRVQGQYITTDTAYEYMFPSVPGFIDYFAKFNGLAGVDKENLLRDATESAIEHSLFV